MAAYASLVSLMHLIEDPEPPVSLDPKQAQSLNDKISFLQRFLEEFHSRGLSKEILHLESRIADVVHKAEDVIESHGVDQILLASRSTINEDIIGDQIPLASGNLYEDLQKIIQDMEIIEKDVIDTNKIEDDQLHRRSMLPLSSSPTPIDETNTMVGFDDIAIRIMERLIGNQSKRDIIALVGMGGSGKTTLARNIYERPLIEQYFHTRSWATMSQQWIVREVLIEMLLFKGHSKKREELSLESEQDLGQQLYQSLFGRRYLVVLDDVWTLEAWEKLKFFLPDNNNGSRVIITSRLRTFASDAGSGGFNVDLMDEDTSWLLLCKKVFADESCPLELEETGKKIARSCRGLPLSIVTIGGLLAKSPMTREYWEYVANNVSSLVNNEDEGRCLNILSLSYINLPVHLKPCFLYMGAFPEDEVISASYLIRLWVADGFLKPKSGETLEVVGEDYLKDLVERNLVLVRGLGSNGKIKFCAVHDLLRDLCIREAKKENFLFVVSTDDLETLQGNEINNNLRRIAIHSGTLNEKDYVMPYSAPFLRTCIIYCKRHLISLRSARLLRILTGLHGVWYYGIEVDRIPVNLRLVSFKTKFSCIWSKGWNLQTLMRMNLGEDPALQIWRMPQLRHVKDCDNDMYLPDPTPSRVDPGQLLVLENLQTLSRVINFSCSEEVAKRIPNLKKLHMVYDSDDITWSKDYCLDSLGCLQHLESLIIDYFIYPQNVLPNWLNGVSLPYSLKKLTLSGIHIHWDNDIMSMTIGSLPRLEVLKLQEVEFIGNEWNPVEGQFCRLKYLKLFGCTGLRYWNADSTHFQCLECLQIVATDLLEFPSGIGDITTLQSIALDDVSDSIIISAKRMLEELEEQFGNTTLVIEVTIYKGGRNKLAKSLASSKNFTFRIIEF